MNTSRPTDSRQDGDDLSKNLPKKTALHTQTHKKTLETVFNETFTIDIPATVALDSRSYLNFEVFATFCSPQSISSLEFPSP